MKVINRTLIFLCAVLLIACFYYFNETTIAKNNIAQKNNELGKVDSLLKAEQFFISGNYQDAFRIYKLLGFYLKADSVFAVRQNWVKMNKENMADRIRNKHVLTKDEPENTYLNKHYLLSGLKLNKHLNDSVITIIYNIELLLKHDSFNHVAKLFKPLEIVSKKGNKLTFFGNLSKNLANGFGVAVWETGSVYYGDWQNNLRNGNGVFIWNDGEKYEGGFSDDLRSGFGKYYFSNGEKYVGQWLNDKRNGLGVLYDKNDHIVFKGNWKNDKPKKNIISHFD